MEHSERLEVAKEIADKIKKKYGKNIVSIGLCGSTIRNEDKKYSDFELIAITKNKSGLHEFLYKDVSVTIVYRTLKDTLKIIQDVSESWQAELGNIMEQKILVGDPKISERFRKLIEKIPDKRFIKTGSKLIPSLFEYVGKIKNAAADNDIGQLNYARYDFIFIALNIVALFNKRYFKKGGFKILDDVKTFPKSPEKFIPLITEIWTSNDIKVVENSVLTLWSNLLKFVKENKIPIEKYNALSQIKI